MSEEITKIRDELIEDARESARLAEEAAINLGRTILAELGKQAARIAELEAALNPFANEASEYDQGQFEDRDSPYFNTFNIGQLRTARAALNHKEPAA